MSGQDASEPQVHFPSPVTAETTNTRCYHFRVSRAGLVLVGGRSSRMGRDKALPPFRGATRGQQVGQAVGGAGGRTRSLQISRPSRAFRSLAPPGPAGRHSHFSFPYIGRLESDCGLRYAGCFRRFFPPAAGFGRAPDMGIIPISGMEPFENVNTPAEWAAYARD